MDQLARLVTVFDQEGAQQLIKSLKDVQTNSKGAETATEQLTDATKKGGAAGKAYSTVLGDMNAHLVAYKGHLKSVQIANDNAAKSMRTTREAGLNLSRQFADIGVTAAMGMNPLMILIQQGPQVADAFAQAASQGANFKTVIRGLVADIVPLIATFAPWIAGLAAVGVGVWMLVDAHNKQATAIKDLNKSLATQNDELNKLSPWILTTGENSNLAAEGQRNFDTWLRKANVSLAEQNRLLRENMLNELNKRARDDEFGGAGRFRYRWPSTNRPEEQSVL
jgi:phage-related minor tail protein